MEEICHKSLCNLFSAASSPAQLQQPLHVHGYLLGLVYRNHLENVAFLFSDKQTCRQKTWSGAQGCAGQGVKKLVQLDLTGEALGEGKPGNFCARKERYRLPLPCLTVPSLQWHGKDAPLEAGTQAVCLPSLLQGRAAAARSLFMQRLKAKTAPL